MSDYAQGSVSDYAQGSVSDYAQGSVSDHPSVFDYSRDLSVVEGQTYRSLTQPNYV